MLLSITAPQSNSRNPQYMEKVFSSILDSIDRRDCLQLLYGRHADAVGLFVGFADRLREQVVSPINGKYPNCSLSVIDEDALDPPAELSTWSCSLRLKPELFPILRHRQFQDVIDGSLEDPLESLVGVVQKSDRLQPRIQITLRPAGRIRRFLAKNAVKRLDRGFFRSHHVLSGFYARHISGSWLFPVAFVLGLFAFRERFDRDQTDATGSRFGDREDDVQAAADKIGGNLFEARICLTVAAPRECEHKARTQLRIMRGAFGAFTKSRLATFRMSAIRRGRPRRSPRFFLSCEELATLFHPATATVKSDQLARMPFTELPPPAVFATDGESGGVVLGRVKYRSDERVFGLTAEDRRRHLYVVGRTGVGKTTLLENLIRSDIAAGRGVCLIDPHGDLAEKVISTIPTQRTNDVIVFDPADPDYAIGFNPLACSDPERRDLVADDVHQAFDAIYGFSKSSPRMSDCLRNALYVLIEKEQTLLDLLRFFSDPAFHQQMLTGIEDEVARMYWAAEFPALNKQERGITVAAIQNKIRPSLLSQKMRSIVSQKGNSLSLREVMDDGRVLIVNLSKGLLGAGNSNLLGALLVSSLQQAAMSRADMPEDDRRDFFAYIDEFQNFSTGSFADILSEARKYRLSMTLAHQYTRQLDEETADAVFGNVGSMIAFQVGSDDAEILVRQLRKFDGQITPEDLTNIPKYHAYVRLLQNGMPEHPFTMTTLAPEPTLDDRSQTVRRASNARYARPKDQVLHSPESSNAQKGTFAPQTLGSDAQVSGQIAVR